MEKESDFQGVHYYVVIPQEVLHDNRLTPLARLIYGELSALANINGYAWISNGKLAKKYKTSTSTIIRSLGKLKELNYIRTVVHYKENSKEVERREIFIQPHTKNASSPVAKTEGGYKQKCNEGTSKNKRDNNTSNNTMNNTDNNIADKSAKLDLDSRFEVLWKLYPRKAGNKQKAKASYKKAIKSGVTDQIIKQGIENLIAENRELKYIPHGQTWFCNERWNDEPMKIGSASSERQEYPDLDLPF
ncbi:helix-turn-helix domain-containing protein [Lactococcus petauri]|uniref:helix-turn-helix domain-containing protein n=1 Tax=Lactococcus petauri TaxID=1940789 RepID=UPI003246CC17